MVTDNPLSSMFKGTWILPEGRLPTLYQSTVCLLLFFPSAANQLLTAQREPIPNFPSQVSTFLCLIFFQFAYFFLCSYMCLCMPLWRLEVDIGCLFLSLSTLAFKTGSLTVAGAGLLTLLPSWRKLQDPSVSTSPTLGL